MRRSPDPPWWWKPHLRIWFPLQDWWQRPKPVKRTPGSLSRGFGYLTLDPSPRLRALRERLEAEDRMRICKCAGQPLPPLPENSYPPDATPLEESR